MLLIAAGLGTAAYVLLTDPEASSFLALNDPFSGPTDSSPRDEVAPVAVNGLFHRTYEWTYKGREYTWEMDLTESSYKQFRDLERPVRRYLDSGVWHLQPAYDMYVSNPDDDPFIDALAKVLLEQSQREGFSEYESLSFALAFVQSLPYARDDVTTAFDEYPRYPVETLVDDGGDCEDTSILFASLVLAMGFGAIMVSPPGHMAVGVAAAATVQGAAYTYRDQRYIYAETTGDDYSIGQIPDEYASTKVSVYDLAAKPLFALDVTFGDVSSDGRQEILLHATQTGSATARDVQLVATLGRGADQIYDEASCDVGDVAPGVDVECRLLLNLNRVPRGTKVSIRCLVQDANYIYDEAESTPWVPRT